MIPAPFEYETAESAAHALSLLATHGEDAKLLAGGHSLLPMMKLRLAMPAVLLTDPAGLTSGVAWTLCVGGAAFAAWAIALPGVAPPQVRKAAALAGWLKPAEIAALRAAGTLG